MVIVNQNWLRGDPADDAFDPTRYSDEMRKVRTPVGQTLARKFPHLEYASIPKVEQPEEWLFRMDGDVMLPFALTLDRMRLELPFTKKVQDFHCITGWSVLDTDWGGVSGMDLIEKALPDPLVTSVMVHGLDEFSTSLWVEDFAKGLLAWSYRSRPLSPAHGFPLRFIAPPHLYQFKSCKWVTKVTFHVEHPLGFWEKRAYSDSALVANNDRYANPTACEGKTVAQIRKEGLQR